MVSELSVKYLLIFKNSRISALFVVFRPDGKELAVATLDGQISFWDQER